MEIAQSHQDQLQELAQHEPSTATDQPAPTARHPDWQDVVYNPFARYHALDTSSCLMTDASGIGHLIVAQQQQQPTSSSSSQSGKLWHLMSQSGPHPTQVPWHLDMPIPPAGICSFYPSDMNTSEDGALDEPTIAVAQGKEILLFRRWAQTGCIKLPVVELGVLEREIWMSFFEGHVTADGLLDHLLHWKIQEQGRLSPRSRMLLQLPSHLRLNVIEELKGKRDVILVQRVRPVVEGRLSSSLVLW